jgi:hypothetical protein
MILLKKPYLPIAYIGETKTFNVYGKSFFDIKNVYLRGFPYTFQQTLFNPFSAVPRLSAYYPSFRAIKLDKSQYSTNNDNILTFTMPSADRGGFVDIIIENRAGYGALTQYVIKDTFNPYTTSDPAYDAYEPYVRPWSQGIKVVSEDFSQQLFYVITIEDGLPVQRIDGSGYIKAIKTDIDPNAILMLDDTVVTTIDGNDMVQIT